MEEAINLTPRPIINDEFKAVNLRDDNTAERIRREVERAAEVVCRGGLILYPTDTVWGIGCDATNPDAVARVYALKRRSDSKALITLAGSMADAEKIVGKIPDEVAAILSTEPRPVTVIYPSATAVASNLTPSDGSLALRITSEEFSRELCLSLGKPLVSTSANISGAPTPQIFAEIDREIIEGVDYVVDYRRDDTRPSSPSKIIRIDAQGKITILRP